MNDLKLFAETLVNLSVKEAQELAQILKDEYGIEQTESIIPAGIVPAVGPAPGAQEKSSFDVILKAPGQAKLAVVKAVKEITGLGLKESNELVNSAPKAIKEGISKEEANAIKQQLEAAGAEIELK